MGLFIGIWALVFFLVVLNGFAAGMVAVLHIWRRSQPRRSRALSAAAIAGAVPLVIVAPAMVSEVSSGVGPESGLIVGLALLCSLAMAASLPGAVLVARKLDGPGDAYRTFE